MMGPLQSGLDSASIPDFLDLVGLSKVNSARQWTDWLHDRLGDSVWVRRGALLWRAQEAWKVMPIDGTASLDLADGHPLPGSLANAADSESLDPDRKTGLPFSEEKSTISLIPLRDSEGWAFAALLFEHQEKDVPPRLESLGDVWILALMAAERLALREMREVTESKAIEVEEQQANFLNIINHELRTPLTAILGFADLAYDLPASRSDTVMRQFIEGIRFSGRNLSQRISELLTMGGISSAPLQVERDECPLPELIREFLEDVLPDVKGHERVRFPGSQPDFVLRADRRHFQRILVHLIDNALKFSEPSTSVRVEWSLLKGRRATDLGDYLRTDIIDTGLGIPEEAHARIFRKFYQIEPSNTRSRGGMGLGLTLAKEFTEAMGGKLWFKSEMGKGSTFSFTIPLIG